MTAPIAYGLIRENRKEPAVIGPQCPNANVRFGSLAVVHHPNSSMAALEGKAASQSVAMLDFDGPLTANSGRSDTDVQTLFVTFGRSEAAWQIHASVRRHVPIHTTLFEVL
jgi:hypothetical protein